MPGFALALDKAVGKTIPNRIVRSFCAQAVSSVCELICRERTRAHAFDELSFDGRRDSISENDHLLTSQKGATPALLRKALLAEQAVAGVAGS
jgi:hypothetical protein